MAYGKKANVRTMRVKSASAWNDSVRDWYKLTFPTDDMWIDINPDLMFSDVALFLVNNNGQDFYDYIGAHDSLVRERIFKEIAENILHVDYEVLYDAWLHGDDGTLLDALVNKSAKKNVAYAKAHAVKASRRKTAADKFPSIDDFSISTSPFGSPRYEWEGNQYYIRMQKDLFKNDYWGWQIAWEDQHNDLLAVSLEHFDNVDDCYMNMKEELLSGAALAVHFDDMKFGSTKRAKAIKPYSKREVPERKLNGKKNARRKTASDGWRIFIGAVLAPACGKWVELPCDDSEIDEAIEYACSEYEKYEGEPIEETMIPDYEGYFGMTAAEMEYADPYELNEMVQKFEDSGLPSEVIECALDCGYDADDLDDIWYIEADDDTSLAYTYIDEMGGVEALGRDTLERYFDYESFGRDLSFDFYQGDGVYIHTASNKTSGKKYIWGIGKSAFSAGLKAGMKYAAKTAWSDDLNTAIDELIDRAEKECLSYADIALAQDILEMLRENELQDSPVYFELANAVFGMDPFEARK